MNLCTSKKYFIVETTLGKVKGKQSTSEFNGKKYCSFLSIPYAAPPLGELRFQPPQDPPSWKEIYDGTRERSACYQSPVGFLASIHLGDEDCLYLNVYTPMPPNDIGTALPVMVFIHGGGFVAGCGSRWLYSPDILMNKNIVLVTVQYRLQALGFLNLGIEQCPGNVGLKDQTHALKWVQKNIENFGGDANNITLFGQSAGATSVHYHMISPLSQGLFHKAIMQSGSCLSPWAFTPNPIDQAFQIGQELKYQGADRYELLDLLKRTPVRELLEAVERMLKKNSAPTEHRPAFPMSTCMIDLHNLPSIFELQGDGEGFKFPNLSVSIEEISEGAFLLDSPENLLKSMKPIPVIYGQNNREGMMIHLGYQGNIVQKLNKEFSTLLKEYFGVNCDQFPNIAYQIKMFYFGNDVITAENGNEVSNLFTDLYSCRFYEAIDPLMKSQIPPYVYLFSYDGSINIFSQILRALNIFTSLEEKGACHGDELGYLFYFKKAFVFRRKIKGDDLKMVNHLTTMWANFATTGQPSTDEVQWTQTTANELKYLEIDSQPKMKCGKIYQESFGKLRRFIDMAIASKP